MNKITFVALTIAVAVSSNLEARSEDKPEAPRVQLCSIGSNYVPARKEDFVLLVLEAGTLFWDKKPIPAEDVVSYVNGLLKQNKVSNIGVYVREGAKYGDVVRAVDLLKRTDAREIGVSSSEIPYGKEP